MHDGTCLMGVFGDAKAVPFEAVFGKVEIPMTSIHTVDFAAIVNGAKTHRIQFINGDMLTGNVGHLAPMKFQTSYGMLTVPMDQVLKMSSGSPVQVAQAKEPPKDVPAPPASTAKRQPVPLPDDPPGPVRPLREIVPDSAVR
jgi:hypothetical protein